MNIKTFAIFLAVALCLQITITHNVYSQTKIDPDDVVKQLYSNYGRGDIDDNGPNSIRLLDKPLSVYKLYFTDRLAKLIVNDRLEEIRTKELGRIDCSILFGSQDCEGVNNIRIKKSKTSNDVIVVYDQNGEKDVQKLLYIMVNTKAGWRISDIRYETRVTNAFPGKVEKWSLLQALTQ